MAMNKILRVALCLLLLAGAAVALVTGLGREDKSGEKPQTARDSEVRDIEFSDGEVRNNEVRERKVQVTGRVRMVGSGTFPELVLSGEEREWYIDKKDEDALRDYQQQTVTVEGSETWADLTFANGFPAGRRYTLHDIKIVKSEK
jgi:hypothetical protein